MNEQTQSLLIYSCLRCFINSQEDAKWVAGSGLSGRRLGKVSDDVSVRAWVFVWDVEARCA